MDDILLMLMFFFFGGGGITVVVLIKEYKKHRPVKTAADADWYIVPGEARMTTTEDTFLRTHTTRIKVSSSSSSGGKSARRR